MTTPSAVRINGPLTMYLNGFSDELTGQGYKPVSATRHQTHTADGAPQPVAGGKA